MEQTPRTRLEDIRQRFIEVGIEALTAVETLELLLNYVSPRADNRILSETVLQKYGSLRHLMSASINQLKTVGGLSESTAVFLSLVGQTGRQMFLESMEQRPGAFASVSDVGRYFMELARGQSKDVFYELCLSGDTFLSCRSLSETGQDWVRSAIEGALESAADNVAVCRRQPGGLAAMSTQDRELSEQLHTALNTVRVSLRDFLVVADDDFISLTETDFGKRPQKKGVTIDYAPF